MNKMLVTVLLLLVFGSSNAGTGRDGSWWPHLTLAEKVMYINGFLDGQTFAHNRFEMNIFEALQDPKTGKYDPGRNPGIIALQTAAQDEFKSGFNGVSPEQLIKGLDKVYADYRNLRIEVADALDVVVKSISGSTEEFSVEMELLGTIEPSNGAAAHREEWIALIAAHSSLEPAQPRQGINPFTKEPRMYKPAPDYACVEIDGTNVGAIHWAMDDSGRLVVSSLPTAIAPVTAIAKEVASRMGWRFIPCTHSQK